MRPLALALMLAVAYGSASAQVSASDAPVCVQAARLPVPAHDRPSGREFVALKGCSALDLYYGVGRPPDPRKARACAYAMRDSDATKHDEGGGDDIEAPAVLSMIYAEARGVAPNLGLAIKFACEVRGGWDDGTPQALELDAMRAQGKRTAKLDFCADDPGRWMNYYCILRDRTWVEDVLKIEEREACTTGSPQARIAFTTLRQARHAYLTAHEPELPNGTVGTVQAAMREEVNEAQRWLAMLREVRSGKAYNFAEADFRTSDQALNAAYRQALQRSRGGSGEYGDTTREQLRTAERAWLKYREAWVDYARLCLPHVPSDRWRTELTLERTEVLSGGA